MKKVVCLLVLSLTSITLAAPVAVDGAIGSEWTGANKIEIGYDADAPQHNFGTPGTANHLVAYDILTRQDAGYLYVAVQTDSARGGSVSAAPNFSNLYFGGEIGMTIGFEVTNQQAFRAGYSGYKPFSMLDAAHQIYFATDFASAEKAIEFAVPINFFTEDPMGWGLTKLDGTSARDFTRVNLSQSFGYSVAGGSDNYGTNRLGGFTVVPEPATMAILGLGALFCRKFKKA